mmetsp:Transcript_57726/g.162803  ORF Transcript_57726/g.162803 Transcript_57726/m.162803 type:complete len:311 (-) Transcript_57726:415-1347(-)
MGEPVMAGEGRGGRVPHGFRQRRRRGGGRLEAPGHDEERGLPALVLRGGAPGLVAGVEAPARLRHRRGLPRGLRGPRAGQLARAPGAAAMAGDLQAADAGRATRGAPPLPGVARVGRLAVGGRGPLPRRARRQHAFVAVLLVLLAVLPRRLRAAQVHRPGGRRRAAGSGRRARGARVVGAVLACEPGGAPLVQYAGGLLSRPAGEGQGVRHEQAAADTGAAHLESEDRRDARQPMGPGRPRRGDGADCSVARPGGHRRRSVLRHARDPGGGGGGLGAVRGAEPHGRRVVAIGVLGPRHGLAGGPRRSVRR